MSDKAPAFQFYPKDWLSDSNVRAMTVDAKGTYIELLCLYWLHGGLPNSTDYLARLVVLPPAKFRRLWPQIAPCFTVDGDQLHQKRMDREREKQDTYRQERSSSGKRGAAKRHGLAMPEPLAKVSSPSAVSVLLSASTDNKRSFSDSEKSPNGNGIPEDQRPAYADAVWSEFLRISEQPVTRLMSPGEYATVKAWMDAGISLHIVLRGMADTKGRGSSLSYFRPGVQEALEYSRQAVPL